MPPVYDRSMPAPPLGESSQPPRAVLELESPSDLPGGASGGSTMATPEVAQLQTEVAQLRSELAVQKEFNNKLSERLDQIQSDLGASKAGKTSQVIDPQSSTMVQVGTEQDGSDVPASLGERSATGKSILTEMTCGELCNNEEEHEVCKSAWDVCIFLGFGWVSWDDFILAVLMLVSNFALQTTFIIIVYANMTVLDLNEDTVAGARHWRGVHGHDFAYADSNSQLSLVSLVCAHDFSLVVSSYQMILHKKVQNYLETERTGFGSGCNGMVMCVLACLCWCLMLLGDMRDNVAFLRAIWEQKEGKPSMTRGADGTVKIRTLSIRQKVSATIFICLPRMFIAVFLCWVGIPFLAYTDNIPDLLLNAMALGFILDIDELFYSAFCPYRIKRICEITQPMTMKSRKTGNLDKVLTAAICVALIVFMWYEHLSQHVKLMQDISDYLCKGTTDFVTTLNPGSQNTYSYTMKPHDQTAAHRDSYRKTQTLVLAAIPGFAANTGVLMSGQSLNQWKDHMASGGISIQNKSATVVPNSLTAIVQLSTGSVEYGSNQLRCVDHLNFTAVNRTYGSNTSSAFYWGMLLKIQGTFGSDATSCTNFTLKANCSRYEYSFLRSICPITCGCANPWQGQMLASPAHGCPGSCHATYLSNLMGFHGGTEDYIESFEYSAKRCKDVDEKKPNQLGQPTQLVLNSTTAWFNYMSALKNTFDALIDDASGQKLFERGMEEGCKIVETAFNSNVNLCQPNQGGVGRSVRPFCPWTCKKIDTAVCTVVDLAECPSGCYEIDAAQINETNGNACYMNNTAFRNALQYRTAIPQPDCLTPQQPPQNPGQIGQSSANLCWQAFLQGAAWEPECVSYCQTEAMGITPECCGKYISSTGLVEPCLNADSSTGSGASPNPAPPPPTPPSPDPAPQTGTSWTATTCETNQLAPSHSDWAVYCQECENLIQPAHTNWATYCQDCAGLMQPCVNYCKKPSMGAELACCGKYQSSTGAVEPCPR